MAKKSKSKKIRVTLRHSIGYRPRGAGVAKHFGPGEVELSIEDAQGLGILGKDGKPNPAYEVQIELAEAARSSTPGAPSGTRAPWEKEDGEEGDEGGEK